MSSNFLNDENKGDIIIYQSESGETKIDVRFQDETVWLTQAQREELFQSSHANVVEHIKNIYSEGELDESSTCRKFRQVRREGNRNVERERLYYKNPLKRRKHRAKTVRCFPLLSAFGSRFGSTAFSRLSCRGPALYEPAASIQYIHSCSRLGHGLGQALLLRG